MDIKLIKKSEGRGREFKFEKVLEKLANMKKIKILTC